MNVNVSSDNYFVDSLLSFIFAPLTNLSARAYIVYLVYRTTGEFPINLN
jgi:hypothetical protein